MKHTIVEIPEIEYALEDFTDYTSSAFLLTALRWMQQRGAWEAFKHVFDLDMKTVRYSPLQKLQTLLASIIVGCHYNKDINARLVPDTLAATLLGLARFPDQSQCNLLLRRFEQANLSQLEAVHAAHLTRYADWSTAHWHGYLLVDIDQCGLVANGKRYELAHKGYFPRRRGEQGYQLSAAWLGQRHLSLALRLDSGNVLGVTRLHEMVELAELRLGQVGSQAIYRVDAGYGNAAQVKWFVSSGRLFIAKALLSNPAKWAQRVAAEDWQHVPAAAGIRVAEVAAGEQVRAIVCEAPTPKGDKSYAVLLTNLGAAFGGAQLYQLYNQRQTIEAFFKTGRHVYGMDNLRSRAFKAIYGFLWLVFIAHNLLSWLKQELFAATALAEIGTRELIEQVGRIPARRERSAAGWRLYLPSQHALAHLFVSTLSPRWVQLSLRLYET